MTAISTTKRTTIDRVPPQNIEAEQAVLGAVLIDRDLMGAVSEIIADTDFYAHVHETIFQTMQKLFEAGHPLDKIAVAEELRKRDALERVGGLSYLNALMDTVQTASTATYYATLVQEKATLRRLARTGMDIFDLAYEGEEDVAGTVEQAERSVLAINERSVGQGAEPMRTALLGAYRWLARDEGTDPLRTGFGTIDHMTTGLHPGNFWIIAARPGMGKTSLLLKAAWNIARQAQADDRGTVLLHSLEMSRDEVVFRLLSDRAQIDLNRLRRRELGSADWADIGDAMGALESLPLAIDETPAVSVSTLRSRARRVKAREGLACIVVDYLQLLAPSVRSRSERTPGNRNEEIADICRSLKATGKELGVPVIAACQLNRAVETRNDKRPQLADLRDSGSIEQEADLVAFLYRDSYYNPESADPEGAEFIVGKQRNGPTGMVPLHFAAPYARYTERERTTAG